MQYVSDTYLRFFDAASLIAKHFDMEKDPTCWLKPSKVAEIIGVPVTVGSATQIGLWAKGSGVRSRKVRGTRYLLLPEPK